MTHATTIQIDVDTRKRLGSFREYNRETYDEILNKLMKVFEMVRSEGKVNEETKRDIAIARAEFAAGKTVSTKEILRKLEAKA